jgi:hypothetical protein
MFVPGKLYNPFLMVARPTALPRREKLKGDSLGQALA